MVISDASDGMSGYAITDENGEYSGAVPSNQQLTITIIDQCNSEIYSDVIGPFSEDTTIPAIILSTTNNFIQLVGSLVNCDNEPLNNGYVKVDFLDRYVIINVDDSGSFNEFINICEATTIDLTGYDKDDLKQSDTATEEVEGEFLIDVASIFVCDDLSEFITYTVDGFEVFDPTPFGIFDDVQNLVVMQGSDDDVSMTMTISATEEGTFTPDKISISYVDSTPQNVILKCQGDCNATIEFTTFEDIGGFMIGSFSGTIDPIDSGSTQEVSGNFKIIIK